MHCFAVGLAVLVVLVGLGVGVYAQTWEGPIRAVPGFMPSLSPIPPPPPTPIVAAPRAVYFTPSPFTSAPYFQQPTYYTPYQRPFDTAPPLFLPPYTQGFLISGH